MAKQPRYETRIRDVPFQTSAPQHLGFAPALGDLLRSHAIGLSS